MAKSGGFLIGCSRHQIGTCTHPYAQLPEKWGQQYTLLLGPTPVTSFYCRIGISKILFIFFILTIFFHIIWSQSCKIGNPAQGYWGRGQQQSVPDKCGRSFQQSVPYMGPLAKCQIDPTLPGSSSRVYPPWSQ